MIFLISILLFQSYLLFSEFKTQQNEELIVLHQSKNSALVYKKGNTAIVLSNQPNRLKNILNNYRTGEKIKTLQNDSLNNSYNIQEKRIYVIDSNAVLDSTLIKVDYLMLTQSPKINLERCLSIIQPKMIIADGSNYTSIVNKWKETCVKKKLPFHYTGEKGAYYFNLKKN